MTDHSAKDRLFVDASLRRFFLVPTDVSLPEGDFTVQAAGGERLSVEPIAIEVFEIAREDAIGRLREALGLSLGRAREALRTLGEPKSDQDAHQHQAWSALFDTSPNALPQDPAAVRAKLAALSSDSARAERTRALAELEATLAEMTANPSGPARAFGERLREATPALREALLALGGALQDAAGRLGPDKAEPPGD